MPQSRSPEDVARWCLRPGRRGGGRRPAGQRDGQVPATVLVRRPDRRLAAEPGAGVDDDAALTGCDRPVAELYRPARCGPRVRGVPARPGSPSLPGPRPRGRSRAGKAAEGEQRRPLPARHRNGATVSGGRDRGRAATGRSRAGRGTYGLGSRPTRLRATPAATAPTRQRRDGGRQTAARPLRRLRVLAPGRHRHHRLALPTAAGPPSRNPSPASTWKHRGHCPRRPPTRTPPSSGWTGRPPAWKPEGLCFKRLPDQSGHMDGGL